MTEIRSIPGSGSGLFATKDYKVGDVIIQEDTPLIHLAPQSAAQEGRIVTEFRRSSQAAAAAAGGKLKDDQPKPSLWSIVSPPSTVLEKDQGKFKGMVQAALCFVDSDVSAAVQEKLLQLYHPHPDPSNSEDMEGSNISPEEGEIVQLSVAAMEYLENLLDPQSKLYARLLAEKDTLRTVMLVWSCNSFDGGRVYDTISRINHSCDPTAVVIAPEKSDGQTIRAAADVAAGDEISISYLGILLYAGRQVRQDSLRQTKHFQCHCQRCTSAADIAAVFPCPACHPRKHQLPEDVQFDDDDDETTVHYVTPIPNGENEHYEYTCSNSSNSSNHATLDGDSKELQSALTINRAVVDKVATFLQDFEIMQQSKGDDDSDNDIDDNGEQELVQGELLEQTLGMASAVVGAKHWTTNLLVLLQLDRTLQTFHGDMLTEGAEPDLEVVAEAIDMLERLCRFAQGLKLQLHMGHLLSNHVIGVARALVSLGDVKSQKYASEWLKRLAGYTEHFENVGVQKVVSALQIAWTRQDGSATGSNEEQDARQHKRPKSS